MAAFLRNLILMLAAAALAEHLMPSGSMGRAGRMALGLVLLYTVLSGLNGLGEADIESAWWQAAAPYSQSAYEQILKAGEAEHGA